LVSETRLSGLSCDVVCVILCLAVLVEFRLVTDGQTDGHRAMASTADALHRAVKRKATVGRICRKGGVKRGMKEWRGDGSVQLLVDN